MTNLAGHDLPSLIEAFGKVDHDRPICFICYTIKGFGLPFAGHKDNHAGLMTPAQMESLRHGDERPAGTRMGQVRRPEHRSRHAAGVPRSRAVRRRRSAVTAPRACRPRRNCAVTIQPVMSTQAGFGALAQRARTRADRARRPDRHRHRPTSRFRPISGRGSIVADCSRARSWPTRSRASAFRPRSTGSSRRRASTSSSASPR